MARLLTCLLAAAGLAGCATHHPDAAAPAKCYTEPGWLDSSNGCSARAGFPDCYLVCPSENYRKKL